MLPRGRKLDELVIVTPSCRTRRISIVETTGRENEEDDKFATVTVFVEPCGNTLV